jgi:GPH family glycoside/pentoside/hexuronide:cation symporter
MAGCGLMPFFLNREPPGRTAGRRGTTKFSQSLRAALRNKPFSIIVAAKTISTLSYNIVAILGLYLNYYYVFRGDLHRAAVMQGWNGTAFQLAGISSLFVCRWLALRHGKRLALIVAAAVLAVGSISKLFIYAPNAPWLQLFVYVANGASAAGMGMAADAMLADISDHDEVSSGLRREGLYASVLVWFDRVGYSVGTLISGFILVGIGFDVKLGGAQSDHTMQLMKLAYFAFPFAGACAVIALVSRYPLDAVTCYATKAKLEYRRAHSATAEPDLATEQA